MIDLYKTAILGCENSHADIFLDLIKNDAEFSEITVLGVFSEDRQAAEALNEKYGVAVMQNYAELAGQLDGVIVTARHGDKHLEYVKPYIESGVSVFMDKPITISIDEAEEMMANFKKYGNKFTGGSCLKHNVAVKKLKQDAQSGKGGKTIGGLLRAPVMMNSPFGGFYFYAQHLVESICEIFGSFPKSVKAFKREDGVNAVFRYEEYDVTAVFTEGRYTYYAVRLAEECSTAENIIVDKVCFRAELLKFYNIMRGEENSESEREFIAPVYIMNAIEKSLYTGDEETVF